MAGRFLRGGLLKMERAVLVHVHFQSRDHRDSWPTGEIEKELCELARSSGVQILEEVRANRDRPAARFFVGTGKVEELHGICHRARTDVVIFGRDLGVIQQRNLEEALGMKVIDRTQLILDIFAQRAKSREGKVQVELAQLRYLLPRLSGQGTALSRLGGGIGTRGPGEQKLEMDRRRIRDRIRRISKELTGIEHRREVAREHRGEGKIPLVALVGYTNAGKSTLLNALTGAGTVSRDQLFTTLDPLTRRLDLPSGQAILITDTVGFLHQLPHHLIEAFRATLEEVRESPFLVHVADASSPLLKDKISAVGDVLEDLGAHEKSHLLVLNKWDQVDEETRIGLRRQFPDAVPVSALKGEGIDSLEDRLTGLLRGGMQEATLHLPMEGRRWLEKVYQEGQVLSRLEEGSLTILHVRLPEKLLGQLTKAGFVSS